MKKLQSWVKEICIVVLCVWFSNISLAQHKFDFEVHRVHFLKGEYSISQKIGDRVHVIELTFKDGCAVKFDQQDSGQATHWRWSKRNIHGKLL